MNRLGFGTLRLSQEEGQEQLIELVRTAYKQGITYFDCAPTYCGGKCEEIVGVAVKPFRQKIMLASKIPLDVLKKSGDLRKFLKESLKRLRTDYLDYYFLWGIKKQEFEKVALQQGFLQELHQTKEEGLIRNIAFSFHDKPEYSWDIINAAEQAGCAFDAMLSQYNMLDRSMEVWIEKAKSKKLTNFVMGAAAGGKLNYELAYRFVWNNPNVDCVLAGFKNIDMVNQNVLLERNCRNLTAADVLEIENEMKKKEVLKELYCTGCGYCMPCAVGINIPEVMANIQEMRMGKNISDNLIKTKCINCGMCEKRCPQRLPIREYIHTAWTPPAVDPSSVRMDFNHEQF